MSRRYHSVDASPTALDKLVCYTFGLVIAIGAASGASLAIETIWTAESAFIMVVAVLALLWSLWGLGVCVYFLISCSRRARNAARRERIVAQRAEQDRLQKK